MTPSRTAIQQQYGLADFGRRVPGLGESNARRAYSSKPSKLPTPDGRWPGGRPWWWESTVDAYARSTGKPVPADARWPLSWPDATGPVPLLPVTEVAVPGYGDLASTVSVLVYDTAPAPVAYVLRHDLDTSTEAAAAAAASALAPGDWPTAIVLVADFRLLGDNSEFDDVEVYRLRRRRPGPGGAVPARAGLLGKLFAATSASGDTEDPAPASDPGDVHAVFSGNAYADQVARVLGRPVPMWFDHTCTPAAVRQSLAYGDAPIIASQSSTDWPAVHAAVHAAVELGVPERWPQAFALLATDAVTTLTNLQQHLADTPRTGDGWYLAALPATPSWPLELEHQVGTAANTTFDAEAAAAELPGLRTAEADLPIGHPAGDVLHDAAGMLAYRLRDTHPDIARGAAPKRTVVEAGGPVTTQYLTGLTRLSDDEMQALLDNPTRRIAALLTGEHYRARWHPEIIDSTRRQVLALYRAPDGRYTTESQPRDRTDTKHHLAIEWPANLPANWGGDTRIAADDSGPGPKLVVALTPRPDGGLHVDLLPHPGDQPRYSWGYRGTGPSTLYKALTRCATGEWQHPLNSNAWISHLAQHPDASALYQAITEHRGQLRLQWTDIRQHVQDDLATLQHLHA